MLKDNTFKFLGDRYRSLIFYLKTLVSGYNEDTKEYGGGGINEVNNKLEDVKSILENLRVDVKLDDVDIGEINIDTTTIIDRLNEIIRVGAIDSNNIERIKTVFNSLISNIKGNTENIKDNTDTLVNNVTSIKEAFTVSDGGLVGINSKISTSNTKLEESNTKLNLIKSNTDTVVTKTTNSDTTLTNIYNLLYERLKKELVLTRAEFNELLSSGNIDASTRYYVIESQSN